MTLESDKVAFPTLHCNEIDRTLSLKWSYSAHVKALSSISKDPPTNGFGGVGSSAIHHPTGILTPFKPFSDMKFKSPSVIYLFQ